MLTAHPLLLLPLTLLWLQGMLTLSALLWWAGLMAASLPGIF
jgi:hypothetical protein